jgi:hypothetical protein
MAHHKMTAHKAVSTTRKLQIHQLADSGLLEARIFHRLVHQAKSSFVIGARFNGKTNTVVRDTVAQLTILKKAR